MQQNMYIVAHAPTRDHRKTRPHASATLMRTLPSEGINMATREQQIADLEKDWAENPRWKNVKRG